MSVGKAVNSRTVIVVLGGRGDDRCAESKSLLGMEGAFERLLLHVKPFVRVFDHAPPLTSIGLILTLDLDVYDSNLRARRGRYQGLLTTFLAEIEKIDLFLHQRIPKRISQRQRICERAQIAAICAQFNVCNSSVGMLDEVCPTNGHSCYIKSTRKYHDFDAVIPGS